MADTYDNQDDDMDPELNEDGSADVELPEDVSDVMEMPDGSAVVSMETTGPEETPDFYANLAEEFDSLDLNTLGLLLMLSFEVRRTSTSKVPAHSRHSASCPPLNDAHRLLSAFVC